MNPIDEIRQLAIDLRSLGVEVREVAKRVEEKQDDLRTQVGLLHSRHDFNEAQMLDAKLTLARMEQAIAGLKPNTEENKRPFDLGYWRGNFLAFTNYPWAFMYPAWPADARKYFRKFYAEAGFTHIPISIWAAYAGQGYDYYHNLDNFRTILFELRDAGIEPCLFVITDAVSQSTIVKPDTAQAFCDYALPKLKDLVRLACLGWELNQVDGWNEREGNRQSGHDMIKLSSYIRWNLPKAEIFLHLQPNWWAPHYEGKSEVDFWRDAVEINGLLYQIRPDSSLRLKLDVENEDDDPKSEDGLYLALKYKGARPDAPGIAGRITAAGKKFVMFEHSRDIERWKQVIEIVSQDKRVSGYC